MIFEPGQQKDFPPLQPLKPHTSMMYSNYKPKWTWCIMIPTYTNTHYHVWKLDIIISLLPFLVYISIAQWKWTILLPLALLLLTTTTLYTLAQHMQKQYFDENKHLRMCVQQSYLTTPSERSNLIINWYHHRKWNCVVGYVISVLCVKSIIYPPIKYCTLCPVRPWEKKLHIIWQAIFIRMHPRL